MAQKITWSDHALITFLSEREYLLNKFSPLELEKFEAKIERKTFILKSNPRLGRKVIGRANTYKTAINRRIVLYYKYKPLKKEIVLLSFWNTLQNPKRLRL